MLTAEEKKDLLRRVREKTTGRGAVLPQDILNKIESSTPIRVTNVNGYIKRPSPYYRLGKPQYTPTATQRIIPKEKPSFREQTGNFGLDLFTKAIPSASRTGVGQVIGQIPEVLKQATTKPVGAAVATLSGLISGFIGTTGQMGKELATGDKKGSSVRIWEAGIENAKKGFKFGFGIGEKGAEFAPTVMTGSMLGKAVGLPERYNPLISGYLLHGFTRAVTSIANDIGTVYENQKMKKTGIPANLEATYKGVKEAGSQGWQFLGMDKKSANETVKNNFLNSMGLVFLLGLGYEGIRSSAKVSEGIAKKLPIQQKRGLPPTSAQLSEITTKPKIKITTKGNSVFIPAEGVAQKSLINYLEKAKIQNSIVKDGVEIIFPELNKLTPKQIIDVVNKYPKLKGMFEVKGYEKTKWGKALSDIGFKGVEETGVPGIKYKQPTTGIRGKYIPEVPAVSAPQPVKPEPIRGLAPVEQRGIVAPSARPQLPSGEGVKPFITPVDSPLVSFQIMNSRQVGVIKGLRTKLEKVLKQKQEMMKGRPSQELKTQIKNLNNTIENLSGSIVKAEKKTIKVSGPVKKGEPVIQARGEIVEPKLIKNEFENEFKVNSINEKTLKPDGKFYIVKFQKSKITGKTTVKKYIIDSKGKRQFVDAMPLEKVMKKYQEKEDAQVIANRFVNPFKDYNFQTEKWVKPTINKILVDNPKFKLKYDEVLKNIANDKLEIVFSMITSTGGGKLILANAEKYNLTFEESNILAKNIMNRLKESRRPEIEALLKEKGTKYVAFKPNFNLNNDGWQIGSKEDIFFTRTFKNISREQIEKELKELTKIGDYVIDFGKESEYSISAHSQEEIIEEYLEMANSGLGNGWEVGIGTTINGKQLSHLLIEHTIYKKDVAKVEEAFKPKKFKKTGKLKDYKVSQPHSVFTYKNVSQEEAFSRALKDMHKSINDRSILKGMTIDGKPVIVKPTVKSKPIVEKLKAEEKKPIGNRLDAVAKSFKDTGNITLKVLKQLEGKNIERVTTEAISKPTFGLVKDIKNKLTKIQKGKMIVGKFKKLDKSSPLIPPQIYEFDFDLKEITKNGKHFKGYAEEFLNCTESGCHINSAEQFKKIKNSKLFTGFAFTGKDVNPNNVWARHSWLVKNNKVIETTSAKFTDYFGAELTGEHLNKFLASPKPSNRIIVKKAEGVKLVKSKRIVTKPTGGMRGRPLLPLGVRKVKPTSKVVEAKALKRKTDIKKADKEKSALIKRRLEAEAKAQKEIDEDMKAQAEIAIAEAKRTAPSKVKTYKLKPEELKKLQGEHKKVLEKEDKILSAIQKKNNETARVKISKAVFEDKYKATLEKFKKGGKDLAYFEDLWAKEFEYEANHRVVNSKADVLTDFIQEMFVKKGAMPKELYSRGGVKKIGDFEKRTTTGEPTEFKLHQELYNLIKKYSPIDTVISEKHVPRGVKGVTYIKSLNTALNSLNEPSVVFHELTHNIDIQNGIVDGILKDNNQEIINDLIDVYLKNYPNAKKSTPINEQIMEGLATLVHRYLEDPTVIKSSYPNLINNILNGKYKNAQLSAMMKEALSIVNKYQGVGVLNKIGVKGMDEDMKLGGKNWFNLADKITMQTANLDWALEKSAKIAGVEQTTKDPAKYLEQFNRVNNILSYNMTPKKGFYGLTKEGFKLVFDKNWGDLTKELKKKGILYDFAHYLEARTYYFDMARRDDFVKELAELPKGEDPADLEEKIKHLNEEIENSGHTVKEIKDAYLQNKDRFVEYEKMVDGFNGETLNWLYVSKKINKEQYDLLKGRKGYSSLRKFILDEMEIGGNTFKTSGKIGKENISALKQRKGSAKVTRNSYFNNIQNMSEIMTKSAKQIVYNKMYEIRDLAPMIYEKVSLTAEGDNIITVYDSKYVKHKLELDIFVADVLKNNFDIYEVKIFEKLIIELGRIFRAGKTTANIFFGIPNLIMDAISNFIFTKNNTLPIYDGLKSLYEALVKKDPKTAIIFDEWVAQGGFQQTLTNMVTSSNSASEITKKLVNERKKIDYFISGLRKFVDVISFPTNMGEIVGRFGEYHKSIKAGKPQIIAMSESAEVSINWRKKGLWGDRVGQLFMLKFRPFGNVSYRILNQMWRASKIPKHRNRMLVVMAVYLAKALTNIFIIVRLYKKAKEKYENSKKSTKEYIEAKAELEAAERMLNRYRNMETYERTSFVNFLSMGDKQFKLKASEVVMTPVELLAMMAADKYMSTNYSIGEYWDTAVSSLPREVNLAHPMTAFLVLFPLPIQELVMPVLGYKTFPTVERIEPIYMQALPSEERYNRRTTKIAKALADTSIAKLWNITPIVIDKWIVALSGKTGEVVVRSIGEPKKVGEIFTKAATASFIKTDYLFSGREFKKFYKDRKDINSDYKKDKSANREKYLIYDRVSSLMSDIKKASNEDLKIPIEYNNIVDNIVILINRGKTERANAILLRFYGKIKTFINPTLLEIEKKKREE